MARVGVSARSGAHRAGSIAGLIGIAAMLAASFSTPVEARRHHRQHNRHKVAIGGGYNPPYADIVVDVKTGRTLHAVNEDALRHPASVTKVMTLYLLFEQIEKGRLALDTPLKVTAHASAQAPSKLGLRPGQTIEVEDAIKAIVTKSANDVAAVIAENVGGSEDAFAAMMTRKARALGMSRTVYRNASGLPDPEQVTTARDLAILARAIQDRFPREYRYFQTRAFNWAGRTIPNHNRLLGRVEGVDGIKTGYTRASGFNLMTSARLNDRHIVAIVLGGRSGAIRDRMMAELVESNMPRAYAGLRTAPPATEVAERPRPAVVAEAPRQLASADMNIDVTATTSATPRETVRSASEGSRSAATGLGTTTPGSMRWTQGPQALPQAAQAYAATSDTVSAPLPPVRATTSPTGKIEARLPAGPASTGSTSPAPSRTEIAEPVKPAPEAKRELAQPRPSVSPWVIQLGAMDDEDKAKSMLADARSRSGRTLANAAAFTEKVVHAGATLYRARFSGFDESDEAQEACRTLKRSGFNCFATRS